MHSRRQTARLAGALYAAMGLVSAISLTYFPARFLLPANAAATAARIASAPLLYRLWTVTDLTVGVLSIYLAMTLYAQFKDVDRNSHWLAFDKPQLDALVLGTLVLQGRGVGALSAYWGLWLLPFGLLVYRSGFIPRLLGLFLIVAG